MNYYHTKKNLQKVNLFIGILWLSYMQLFLLIYLSTNIHTVWFFLLYLIYMFFVASAIDFRIFICLLLYIWNISIDYICLSSCFRQSVSQSVSCSVELKSPTTKKTTTTAIKHIIIISVLKLWTVDDIILFFVIHI